MAQAFGIAAATRAALQRDATPFAASGMGVGKIALILLAIFIATVTLGNCSDKGCDTVRSSFGDASNEYQQCLAQRGSGGGVRGGGGSFGGWSSGGGHKCVQPQLQEARPDFD